MGTVTLYHGSTMQVEKPLTKVGRSDLDFGKGFYLTRLQEQALSWANRMRLIRAESIAYINVYELDLEQALADGYRMLCMKSYDKDWLDFITKSRNGEQPWKQFDIIEGGVANDRVIDTVENYINGDITAEQALGQLIYAQPNNQLCILSQEVIDKYLTYTQSIIVE